MITFTALSALAGAVNMVATILKHRSGPPAEIDASNVKGGRASPPTSALGNRLE